MTMVTVYTQPGCTQCKATIAFLAKHNLPHEVVDIREHPALVDELTQVGRTTLPYVTVTRDETKVDDWSGHNMYKLIELKTRYTHSVTHNLHDQAQRLRYLHIQLDTLKTTQQTKPGAGNKRCAPGPRTPGNTWALTPASNTQPAYSSM